MRKKFEEKLEIDVQERIDEYKESIPEDLGESLTRIEKLEQVVELLRKRALKYAKYVSYTYDRNDDEYEADRFIREKGILDIEEEE